MQLSGRSLRPGIQSPHHKTRVGDVAIPETGRSEEKSLSTKLKSSNFCPKQSLNVSLTGKMPLLRI